MGPARGRLAVIAMTGLGALLAVGSSGVRGVSARAGARTLHTPAMTAYQATVRAVGGLVISFHAGAACADYRQCDVQSATMTWTVPPVGGLGLVDAGPRSRPRLRGYVELDGSGRPDTRVTVAHAGSGLCTDTSLTNDVAQLPLSAAGPRRLRFGLYAAHLTPPWFGPPQTPTALAFAFTTLGAQPDEPAPLHCGGPIPGDVLPRLPGATVSLAQLQRGPSTVDLAGRASFSAGGLTGTVRSTIVLHIAKLRVSTPASPPPPPPLRAENRVLTVHYRVRAVTGAIPVDLAGDPLTCAPRDACGLTGTVIVRPRADAGQAQVIAYDDASVSERALSRAVGLTAGRSPLGAQVGGMVSWAGRRGTVAAALARNDVPACSDHVPLPIAGLLITVTGNRATATFGASGGLNLQTPSRDLLRTRCPGPAMADLVSESGLAQAAFPARWLGRPTLTLHLTRGVAVHSDGFRWRTRPSLTVVLTRTGVTEALVPSSAFET